MKSKVYFQLRVFFINQYVLYLTGQYGLIGTPVKMLQVVLQCLLLHFFNNSFPETEWAFSKTEIYFTKEMEIMPLKCIRTLQT